MSGKAGGAGGATNIISNITDTALKLYLAKKQREAEEKKRKEELLQQAEANQAGAAAQHAGSELKNTGMMGSYFLKTLLGG